MILYGVRLFIPDHEHDTDRFISYHKTKKGAETFMNDYAFQENEHSNVYWDDQKRCGEVDENGYDHSSPKCVYYCDWNEKIRDQYTYEEWVSESREKEKWIKCEDHYTKKEEYDDFFDSKLSIEEIKVRE